MRRFFARLKGSEEVPPVSTIAKGSFVARLSNDGRVIRFRLIVEDIRNVFVAYIHLGERGENGPIVAFLAGPLSRPGTIRRDDLVGPLRGLPLTALIREMRLGNTYVNVHTTQNPDGEIRGQIRRF